MTSAPTASAASANGRFTRPLTAHAPGARGAMRGFTTVRRIVGNRFAVRLPMLGNRKPLKRYTQLKRRKPMRAKRAAPRKSERKRDPRFLEFVRERPCIAMGLTDTRCLGRVHAHHAGPRPHGRKADDDTCIPLCAKHHARYHDTGKVFPSLNKEEHRMWFEAAIRYTRDAYMRHAIKELEGVPL